MRGCLAVLAVMVAGCYEPPSATCAIRCTGSGADACPASLTCNDQGYCVGSAGDVCTTALAEVRIGAHHACGLDGSGGLYCWGDDENGQVGLGNGSDGVIQPTAVGDPAATWTALATGGDHTCAIKGGEVYCWGQNDNGESRGNAGGIQTTPFKVALSPTTPLPAGGFTQVAAGGEHSCAIGGGQLWCWGAKEAIGQDHSFMERVGTLDDWTAVSTGKTHTCGISTSMGLLCFGRNDRGQLGQTDFQDRATPTAPANGLPTGKVPLHVLAGAGYTCTILGTAPTDTMGELWCWGENGNKEIDDNNGMNPYANAKMMAPAADWTAITGGARRLCGLRGGHAFCWGQTDLGGLGDGIFNEQIAVTAASDLGAVDDIQLGVSTHDDAWDDLGCLMQMGEVKCFGDNSHGDVGAGVPASMSPRGVEVHAPNAHAWAHVASGHHHNCATTDDGTLWCWGADDSGQVSGQPGRGDATAPCIPGEPCNFALPQLAPVKHADTFSSGNYDACALDGTALTCWGSNDHGALGADGNIVRPVAPPPGETWARVMGGDRGNCATTVSGKLYCWGYLYNQVSQNTPLEQTDPDLLPAMIDMKLGDNFACGVRMDHTRICWGQNNNYQLGEGYNSDVNNPSADLMFPLVDAISLRNDHVCAIGDTDHHVACWGSANDREHGSQNNPVMTPNAVTDAAGQGLTMCSSVATGDGHSCAACMGTVQCWGGDFEDELGRGTHTNAADEHAAPVALPAGMMFTELSSGSNHTCAVSSTGRLFCWGWGVYGELGNGGKAMPVPTLLAPAR